MRIVWKGNFDLSGFGHAAVDYVVALKKLGVDIKIVNTSVPILKLVDIPLNTKQLEIKTHKSDDILIQHVPPNAMRRKDAAINIGCTTFESPKIPNDWLENLNDMDGLIVPTKWNKEILVDHGVSDKRIHVIPYIINYLNLDPSRITPLKIRNKKDFSFLSIIDFTYRKGWDLLLEAYWTEFKADENVSLILKSYHRSFGKNDRATVREHILEKKDKLKFKSIPHTLIYDWPIHDNLMPALYKSCQAYVFPTRGEGFSLTCAEAMALEVPVIATDYGGHLDYMNYHNSTLVRFSGFSAMTKEQLHLSPQYDSMPFTQPSVAHLRECMRKIYIHYDEYTEKAKKSREDIKHNFSEITIGVQLLDTIEKIAYS